MYGLYSNGICFAGSDSSTHVFHFCLPLLFSASVYVSRYLARLIVMNVIRGYRTNLYALKYALGRSSIAADSHARTHSWPLSPPGRHCNPISPYIYISANPGSSSRLTERPSSHEAGPRKCQSDIWSSSSSRSPWPVLCLRRQRQTLLVGWWLFSRR